MDAERGGVLVLDFGSQFAQLITRRVRELQVHAALVPFDISIEEIQARNPVALILSGSPSSVYDADGPKPDPALWSCGIPILGICYGVQLMAQQLGGKVGPSERREYGPAEIQVRDVRSPLFVGVGGEGDSARVWMSHGDSIIEAPTGFTPIATTDSTPFAALVDVSRNLWGIQFHPEVVHTPGGRRLLENFVIGIAKATPNWTRAHIAATSVEAIAAQVGPIDRVLCALSGGVDSAVAAAMVHQAIGDRLTCVYVDHGLMRKNESALLREAFAEKLGMKIVMVHYVILNAEKDIKELDRFVGLHVLQELLMTELLVEKQMHAKMMKITMVLYVIQNVKMDIRALDQIVGLLVQQEL